MQDRYVGDVGDFGKYGLLRFLAGNFDELPPLTLGMIWYKVPNESHNNDGSKTQYLWRDDSQIFEACDPSLYRAIRTLVSDDCRTLRDVQKSRILPRSTRFFEDELNFEFNRLPDAEQRADWRRRWLRRALRKTASCDIVFADPDNGLQCASIRGDDRRGPKYALHDEVLPIIDRDQTLVVYHHTSRRGTADEQVCDKLRLLRALRPGIVDLFALRFRRGNSRAFLIIPAKRHSQLIRRRTQTLLASLWQRHFNLVTL
jgi:hypothetical protein